MLRRALRFATHSLRAFALAAAAAIGASCHEGLDTTRQAPPKATLGDDIYGAMCDRVGAGALTEDLTGASYHAICHHDAKGKYGSKVDRSVLPPVSGDKAKKARELAVAKVEAMARHRSDLVRAFNAIFPDEEIDDPTTKDEGDTVRLHDALMKLAQDLVPLYEKNPFDEGGEPLVPHATRALGRLFDAIGESEAAREALSRIGKRQGYRPFHVALGAIRPALAYPRLRSLTKASLGVLGPKGWAVPQLQQLLTVSKQELLTSKPVLAPLADYLVDAKTAQPNRPRTNVEVLSAFLLSQHDSFAASPNEPPRYVVRRDRRGFAVPLGSSPGIPGTVPPPFADVDGDGHADVDAFGRFLDTSGAPLAIDPPFAIPGVATLGPVDAFGRPADLLYEYVDTSRAMTGALARRLVPLLDPTRYASDGDPEAWRSEHETMMYALAGAYLLYGRREPAQYDYVNEAIVPEGQPCDGCVPYVRFRGEDSPIADLVHAAGQVLADADSDALLLSMLDWLENHEQVVARLVGAALRVRQIALEHDEAAAKGLEPFAEMPYETPIWDEMAAIVARIVKRPGLLAKLLGALADPAMVTQKGDSRHVGDTLARFLEMRDALDYNRFEADHISDPAINVTDGYPSTKDPHNPVDRTKPPVGENRSCFERSLQMIHDAAGVKACNKPGAEVKIDLGFIDVSWPLFGSYEACELFAFDDLAKFYLDALLPKGHPKKSRLSINDETLTWLVDTGKDLGLDPDELFEQSSGIAGLTLVPEPPALNRLVFFGASSKAYPGLPDHDALNAGGVTDTFVSSLIEPVASAVCPKQNGVNQCAQAKDLLRLRGRATIFLWERLGFYDYLRPMVVVFANESCNADVSACSADTTGEQIFIDLVNVLYRHWPGKQHGDECEKAGTAATNPRYCSEAGVNTYEPILADAFQTDLIPALHEFAKVATELSKITVARGPHAGETWTGAEVLERLTRILFDPEYAAKVGMVDRKGNKSTKWVDGTVQPQLTAFTLFTDALRGIDLVWEHQCDGLGGSDLEACKADVAQRKGQWKRARSQLVDEFFAVEGDGQAAKFKNRAFARTMTSLLRVLREQLNANCPDREQGAPCTWAKKELADKLATTLSGPLFAAMMDLQEAIRLDETARRELEKFLVFLLEAASSQDAFQATLASMSDLMQVLADDAALSPIFNAVSTAASPASDDEPGCADTTVKLLEALTNDEYDRYHVLDHVLARLVTPMDGGQGKTPIEVFMDAIADVNRIDAAAVDEPLEAEDYRRVMGSVRDFFTSEARGLEQFYFIVQNRPKK